jgi:succinoglycan biosynthesis protein ExoV
VKLYYSYSRKGNFGDDLNPYIFSRLFPGLLDDDHRNILVGIGSILNHKVPKKPFKYVFGSGFGYGGRPDFSDKRWKIYCVRGPYTAAKLRIDASLAVTDPAALVSRYFPQSACKTSHCGFIPHFESLDFGFWPQVASQAGLRFINPRASISSVVEGIQSCNVIVTESLHGAIVSDCLRIPWIAVRPLVASHHTKWLDWASSLGIALCARELFPSSRCEARNALWNRIKAPIKTALASNPLTLQLLNGAPQTEALEFHRGDDQHHLRGIGTCMPSMTLLPNRIPSLGDQSHIERAAFRLRELCKCEPQLSSDIALNRAIARLDDTAERMRREFNLSHT